MKNKFVSLIILLVITTIGFIALWFYLSPVSEKKDDKKIEEVVIEDKKPTPIKTTADKEEKRVEVEKKILPDEIIIATINFNYLDKKKGNELGDIIIYNLNYYFNESTELVLDKLRVERVFNDGERDRVKIIKWLKEIDMNNDNSKEFLIIFSNPSVHAIAGSTHYFIVISKDEENFKYKIDFIESVFFMPEYFVKDINNDKTVEIIIKSITAGIRVGNFVNIFQYNHQEEQWGNILKASMTHGDIKIVDKNNDNIYEVTLFGGDAGPVGMGMQRPRTEIYTYQQNKFTLTQVIKKEVDNIYFLMIDAHYALKENNLERVLELTTKALENPDMGIGYFIKKERCKPRILSYTAILRMIAHLKQSPSNIDKVNFLLEEIKQKYNYTDNPFINAAQVFRDTYINTKDVIYACQAMENEIIKAGEKAEFLWWYGRRTERIDIRNLCPFISTKGWEIYKNEKYGFKFKIPPFFVENGYKIVVEEKQYPQLAVTTFKTKPLNPDRPNRYFPMKHFAIYSQEYCKNKGKEFCNEIRTGIPKRKGGFVFSRFLIENENYFIFLMRGPGSGDPWCWAGWLTDMVQESSKQMLITFQFLE